MDNIQTYIFKQKIVQTIRVEASCESEAKEAIKEDGCGEILNSMVTDLYLYDDFEGK